MHNFFVACDAVHDGVIEISGDDASHISKSLRLSAGNEITVSDGNGNSYLCLISSVNKKAITCKIIKKSQSNTEPPIIVDLYQGIPKASKMDLIVQKCTEIGINSIIPVETERTVVKLKDGYDLKNKLERWQRIAEEAAKQSRRGHIPSIMEPVLFKNALEDISSYDLGIIPYEEEHGVGLKEALKYKNNAHKIMIFIGPEGGFSDSEILTARVKNVLPVTMGPRILRTETAGFVCLSIIMYEIGDMG
ncbi:MAG: 16S rRNA (uracil(1498)-N(3))-methyltransferase [Clostridiales bacterium]|nr:16S rRNA (uracil(1498)-N(3))-methyltransferase [Clostridiales bacterium]